MAVTVVLERRVKAQRVYRTPEGELRTRSVYVVGCEPAKNCWPIQDPEVNDGKQTSVPHIDMDWHDAGGILNLFIANTEPRT
jgi:hypothetical protein